MNELAGMEASNIAHRITSQVETEHAWWWFYDYWWAIALFIIICWAIVKYAKED